MDASRPGGGLFHVYALEATGEFGSTRGGKAGPEESRPLGAGYADG